MASVDFEGHPDITHAIQALNKAVEDFTGMRPLVVDRSCQHNWQTHTQVDICGTMKINTETLALFNGPIPKTIESIIVTKIYCSHCLMVKDI